MFQHASSARQDPDLASSWMEGTEVQMAIFLGPGRHNISRFGLSTTAIVLLDQVPLGQLAVAKCRAVHRYPGQTMSTEEQQQFQCQEIILLGELVKKKRSSCDRGIRYTQCQSRENVLLQCRGHTTTSYCVLMFSERDYFSERILISTIGVQRICWS